MDLVLKGRGVRITDQIRRTTEHKLAKISRLDPRAQRIEVEVIEERNPRSTARTRSMWQSLRAGTSFAPRASDTASTRR